MLGFDLLIDEDLKAWLLEVNDHPSLNIYFDTEFMSHRVMKEEDECPLDLYVKGRVVGDTIKLVKKKDFFEHDSFRSLEKVHPSEDSSLTDLVLKLQQLFYGIAKIREKNMISAQSFEKMADKPLIQKLGLKKYDLSLLMQSVTSNAKSVDFLQFCDLMLHFWKQKVMSVQEMEFEELIDSLL